MATSAQSATVIETQFGTVQHVYQFATPAALYDQLTAMIRAKFSLASFDLHYVDDDGDQCRITNEIEIQEAVRVSAGTLQVTVTSDSESIKDFGATLTTGTSPTRTISLTESSHSHSPLPDIADYSSDEEGLYEAARLAQPAGQPPMGERLSDRADVPPFFLQSENVRIVDNGSTLTSDELSLPSMAMAVPGPASAPAVEPHLYPQLATAVFVNGSGCDSDEKVPAPRQSSPASHSVDAEVVSDQSHSNEPLSSSFRQFYRVSRSWSSIAASSPSPAVASQLAAFFSDPTVVSIINANIHALLPHMADLPLFVYQITLHDMALLQHPFVLFVFARAQLHAHSTCVLCHRSPIIGERLDCENCRSSLCDECAAVHDHTHFMLRHQVPNYEFDDIPNHHALASSPRSAKRKFIERVSSGLAKVDTALSTFVDDVKRLIHEAFVAMEAKHEKWSKQRAQRTHCLSHATSQPVSEPSQISELLSTPVPAVMDPSVVLAPVVLPTTRFIAEVEQIREMGFIHSATDEATVIELLNGSSGNVDLVIQWMVERLDMGN